MLLKGRHAIPIRRINSPKTDTGIRRTRTRCRLPILKNGSVKHIRRMTPSLNPIAVHAGTLQRLLKDRAYFRGAPTDVFREAEQVAAMVGVADADPILAEGEASPYAWFLVEGAVSLQRSGQADRTLKANDPDAGYPVANLRPSCYAVRALEDTKLIRIEQSFLKGLAETPPPVRFLGGTELGGGSWQSHPFALEVLRLQQAGEFKIPRATRHFGPGSAKPCRIRMLPSQISAASLAPTRRFAGGTHSHLEQRAIRWCRSL